MTITDQYMRQMITKPKEYTIVILKSKQKRNEPEAEKIIELGSFYGREGNSGMNKNPKIGTKTLRCNLHL